MKTRFLMTLFSIVFLSGSCTKQGAETKPAEPATQTVVQKVEEPAAEVEVDPALAGLSPMESIKELDRKIESYKSGPNLTAEEIEANRKLKEQIIRGTFDLYELCRMALAEHWDPLNDEQRKYFANLMTRLLERKAIFSKEQVKGTGKPYKVSYNQEEFLDAEKKTSRVSTKILVPSEKIDLNINYKLISTPKGWKIFDVIVDDASLVENYKFQFDTIIKKYGYQELINRMEKKLKEMQ